jgi:hypothetical protein
MKLEFISISEVIEFMNEYNRNGSIKASEEKRVDKEDYQYLLLREENKVLRASLEDVGGLHSLQRENDKQREIIQSLKAELEKLKQDLERVVYRRNTK